MCGLSNASAMIRYGETVVMCNVVMSPKPREGVDFFPLNVEYEEKLYAAGRIPGSFMRREGRPGERADVYKRQAQAYAQYACAFLRRCALLPDRAGGRCKKPEKSG